MKKRNHRRRGRRTKGERESLKPGSRSRRREMGMRSENHPCMKKAAVSFLRGESERLKNYFKKYLCLFRQFSVLVPSSLRHIQCRTELLSELVAIKQKIIETFSVFLLVPLRSNMFYLLLLAVSCRFNARDKKSSWEMFFYSFPNGKILCDIYIHFLFMTEISTKENFSFACVIFT